MRKWNAATTGIDIIELNRIYSCPIIQNVACKIISDAQIRTWVEQIYLSMIPRQTRTQLVSLIFQKAKEESQEGEEIQISSETLITIFYLELKKDTKYKIMVFKWCSKQKEVLS